jgi:hypothetical protein
MSLGTKREEASRCRTDSALTGVEWLGQTVR